jgi:hypothetical protein
VAYEVAADLSTQKQGVMVAMGGGGIDIGDGVRLSFCACVCVCVRHTLDSRATHRWQAKFGQHVSLRPQVIKSIHPCRLATNSGGVRKLLSRALKNRGIDKRVKGKHSSSAH